MDEKSEALNYYTLEPGFKSRIGGCLYSFHSAIYFREETGCVLLHVVEERRREGWILSPAPHLFPQYTITPEPDLTALFAMYVLQKSFKLFYVFCILLEKQFGNPNIPARPTSFYCWFRLCKTLPGERYAWMEGKGRRVWKAPGQINCPSSGSPQIMKHCHIIIMNRNNIQIMSQQERNTN